MKLIEKGIGTLESNVPLSESHFQAPLLPKIISAAAKVRQQGQREMEGNLA